MGKDKSWLWGSKPRKMTPEMEDFIEIEFFYSIDNRDVDLQEKLKKKFDVDMTLAPIRDLLRTFFLPNGKVRVSRNLQNERAKRNQT